jgi:hypothetical protein
MPYTEFNPALQLEPMVKLTPSHSIHGHETGHNDPAITPVRHGNIRPDRTNRNYVIPFRFRGGVVGLSDGQGQGRQGNVYRR